jgi:putative tryptophan/tyrosine transport system substrate-binding protein
VASFNIQLVGKRFGLLCDLVPRARTVAYLSGTSTYGNYEEQRSEILSAARVQGRQVIILEVRDDRDYEAAFTSLIQGQAGGLVVGAFTFRNLNRILALAADHKVPTIYTNSGSVAAGGLMSYGAVIFDIYRQIGIYAGRILKGEKPDELPVMRPTKFELVNLKTAKALGIEVPETLLATADKVIE